MEFTQSMSCEGDSRHLISSPLSPQDSEIFTVWCNQTENQLDTTADGATFLSCMNSIPDHGESSLLSLAMLAFLVSRYPARPPAFETLRLYTKLWLSLPEGIKAGRDQKFVPILENFIHQITADLDIVSLFCDSQAPALIDPTTKRTISHQNLSSFINNFSLPLYPWESNAKPVVSLALPNGYLLGLATLAVASYYTVAPLNIAGGAVQFQSDASLASPQCILVLESDVQKLGLDQPWVSAANIQVLVVQIQPDMTFNTQSLNGKHSEDPHPRPKPSSSQDLALILFTSGTSGTKKVVPTTVLGLLLGVTCVIDSWGLTPQDSCINMMPLNHVGGLVRNLFAPVLSGGSSILCPAFDPNLFWDTLEDGSGTWYYASPSMHMSILLESGLRSGAVAASRLRLVCNAAGGLLPALALRLRDTFQCTVLPSYGMTECMPISTPPLDYSLNRTGTSGLGCGPEISILDESENRCRPGEVGRINVRSGPTFPGYLKNGKIDKSAFNDDGWFDTGDLGMLDNDGYLYLTGRGKEVINRGGEIISPFEVEEAITIAFQNIESPLYERVEQVLAFSAPHETLQEVVGVALVCPSDLPCPDIRDLHTALKASLHSSKLPVTIVYMNALPTSNNKLVRIKFAERMDMAPITNDTSMIERHFNAICPPTNSSLKTKIYNSACELDFAAVSQVIESHLHLDLEAFAGTSHHDGTIVVYLAPRHEALEVLSYHDTIEVLREAFPKSLPGFLIPSSILYLPDPFPHDTSGLVDAEELHERVKAAINSISTPAGSKTETQVRKAFAEVLDFGVEELCADSDFFDLGGDSMSAGRLLSTLRRDLGVRIPVDQIFTSSRVSDICKLVDQSLEANFKNASGTVQPQIGCTKTCSSTNPLVLLVSLLPIVVIFPMKLAFQWTLLMYFLSIISHYWLEADVPSRFLGIVASMFIARAFTQIIAPIFGIVFKWGIIGKYSEGMYPMWGLYHTRWWIVEKTLQICEQGVFGYFDFSRTLYYRLLGAKIGSGVVIEKSTTLGEYDLLEIGDNVRLDRCVCRPFAVERNASMYLGRIKIGKDSIVGLKAHVAAGSTLPESTFIGANSSSYEMDNIQQFDGIPLPKPHVLMQMFCIIPVQVVVLFISSLPWMGGLFGMVANESQSDMGGVQAIITWWATTHRIGFHYLALVLNVSVRPFVWLACVLLIKKTMDHFFGTAEPKPFGARTSQDNFRTHLMSALVPHGGLTSITKLFGSHYEFTSIVVRAMGGKVGKRVYWPGTGPTIEDISFLEVDDDVVFGSRSHIITTDSTGSWPVKIGKGAMIADRVVLSPGANVGERAVIGTGAFIKRGQVCGSESVWVGNRKGSAVCLSNSDSTTTSKSTSQTTSQNSSTATSQVTLHTTLHGDEERGVIYSEQSSDDEKPPIYEKGNTRVQMNNKADQFSTPFGRAFYEGKAPYHVFGQTAIFLYSTFIMIVAQMFWNVGVPSTVLLAQIINHTHQFDPHGYRPIKIYVVATACISALLSILSVISIALVIAAKWIILGRRKPGSYDWDQSSYCQRWQLFLTIEAIRRKSFGGHGVLGLLTGTHFCVLYFRALGAKIGKDCALFAGGRPSLMFTEPDLLTLGDRVSVDDASLVGHINSRGKFSLNELSVGSRSVLRSGTRLLSGAKMGEDAILLEHTLIMAGDVADDGTAYQGWPADVYRGDRLEIVSNRS